MGIEIHNLMLHNIRMGILKILPILLLFLSACVPTTTRDDDTQIALEIKEIEEDAILLFESGRYSEAGIKYISLSQKNRKKFTFYITKAIDAYVKAKEYNKAIEIINNNSLNDKNAELENRVIILNAYQQLNSGKPGGAINLLKNLPELDIPKNFKVAFYEIFAKASLGHGNYIEAIVKQLKLAKYLIEVEMINSNTKVIWKIFESIPEYELEDLRIAAPDELTSWFELVIINQTYKYQPKKLKNAIDGWAQRYENHFAYKLITDELVNESMELVQRPSKIGLLLPVTGTYKKSAAAVRDGFLAAWYLDKQEKAEIQIYDANSANVIEIYKQALKDGVDYIVGPLEKEATNQLYSKTDISIKVLALNRQDIRKDEIGNKNLIQFGLSPKDEAIQIAEIAMSDGHKHALVLTPDTPWGDRLTDAFSQHWVKLGGEITGHVSFINNTTDFSTPVKELLNIDKSEQRARKLRNKLNRKIHSVERRRQDVDFIFTATMPDDARQLIPQIRFHHADNLPIYSTSHIFTGIVDAAKDIDLNDVVFVDMPWILNTERQLSIIQDALNRNWSQEKSQYRRLYALGIDAYNLIPDINRLNLEENSFFLGETGRLIIGPTNIVERNLRKAKFLEGKPVLLN